MDEKEFEKAYRKIKFEENPSDCYSVAGTKRKTLLLNFYGSILMKEDNSVTEFLLSQDLESYSKVVDNKEPGNVNNYADYVLALLSNYQNDERKNWKSHLDEFDVKGHLENLPCSNGVNCKYSDRFEGESLEKFKQAIDLKKEVERTENFQKNESPANAALERINLLENSVFEPKTARQFNRPHNDLSHSSHFKAEESDRSNSFNAFRRNNTFETSVFEPKTVRQFNAPNNDLPHSSYSKAEESERVHSFDAFRTARDELQIQNAKKFGKGGNAANDKNYNYGATKKSLGTRKGGVFGKFQPPLKPKDNRNDGQSSVTTMEVDEVVDERLKNIDPAMIELIKNEIMYCGSKITWDDIAGLHLAKSTIQEIVVWPMLRPDIFTGLRRPPKGILLFGPPGTGKTLIGKCIASQSNSTFFSISASSLTSKWVGDGEKMVRTLFAVAKVHQPSVVFIDEIDSLLSQRSDSEHECSRRIKTEFLVQLDGAGTGEEDRILIIGATNRPQELDEAARRRLVKRLYIPLPDEDARKQIIRNLISSERHSLTDTEIDRIAILTKGYSGADVKNLCQEASLGPIRSIAPSLIHSINPSDVRPLNSTDFDSALCRIKSSVSESDLDIYLAWDKQYGCGSSSTTNST